MTYYSRTDIDTTWAADTGDDDDQHARHSGMERERQDPDIDPATLAQLPPRDSTASMPASSVPFDEIGIRAEWHSASPPAAVAAAWSALEEAIEAALEAERAEGALTLEQASAERIERARVTKLIAAGKEAKPSAAGVDWPAARRHLEAISAGRRVRAHRCRDTYDDLVEQHRPDWAARIVAQLPDSKAATLDALAKAGLMVERLFADAEAAQALLLVEGGSLVALPTLPVKRFLDAMQALAGEIESSSPLGGEGLVHPRMDPPYRDREQISASIRAGVVDSKGHWLADLERREQYRQSSFTRGIPLGEKPSEPTW